MDRASAKSSERWRRKGPYASAAGKVGGKRAQGRGMGKVRLVGGKDYDAKHKCRACVPSDDGSGGD